jgi:hypothetical protein
MPKCIRGGARPGLGCMLGVPPPSEATEYMHSTYDSHAQAVRIGPQHAGLEM